MNSNRWFQGQNPVAGTAPPRALLRLPRLVVDVGVILAFVTVILVTNYALAGYPNVKLFDLLVFTAGYTLGFRRGAAVAIGAWMVYGNFNPYGLTTLPLLFVVTASETLYAGAGALIRRAAPPSGLRFTPGWKSLIFGGAAIVCTLGYDLLTNIYTGVHWAQLSGSTDYIRWVSVALFNPGALFFMAAHVASNFTFFAAFAPALVKGAAKIKGG